MNFLAKKSLIIYVLIISGILRLIAINQSLWLDEATSALTTQMPLVVFFNNFLPGDFHPPMYYLVLRFWTLFVGGSEIGLRSLSVVFGIGTIYLVYLIGKRVDDQKTGLIASILLATSGLHIYYSQEARMYSMSAFMVSLSIFLFIRIFHERSRVVEWLLFSLTLVLIGSTDYLPLLILPIFWLMGIFSRKNIKWWKKFLMSHIILIVFALLWLPAFLLQFNSGINVTNTSPAWVQVLGKFSLKEILLIPVKFEIGRITILDKKLYGLVVGIVTLTFAFVFFKASKNFTKLRIIWLWLLVPVVIALVISVKIPVLNYFRFLFILPAFYLIVASGIKNKAILVLIILINLSTSFMYLTNKNFQREDWRGAVSFIKANRGENSSVVFPTRSQHEAYRYYDSSTNISLPTDVNGNKELWFIRYAVAISDSDDEGRKKVESFNYTKTNEYDFNGVTVWKYKLNL